MTAQIFFSTPLQQSTWANFEKLVNHPKIGHKHNNFEQKKENIRAALVNPDINIEITNLRILNILNILESDKIVELSYFEDLLKELNEPFIEGGLECKFYYKVATAYMKEYPYRKESKRNFTHLQLKQMEGLWEALRSKTKGDGDISEEENYLMIDLGIVIRLYKDGKLDVAEPEVFEPLPMEIPSLSKEADRSKLVICEQNLPHLIPNITELFKNAGSLEILQLEQEYYVNIIKDIINLIDLRNARKI